jgi:hypothetical protein
MTDSRDRVTGMQAANAGFLMLIINLICLGIGVGIGALVGAIVPFALLGFGVGFGLGMWVVVRRFRAP